MKMNSFFWFRIHLINIIDHKIILFPSWIYHLVAGIQGKRKTMEINSWQSDCDITKSFLMAMKKLLMMMFGKFIGNFSRVEIYCWSLSMFLQNFSFVSQNSDKGIYLQGDHEIRRSHILSVLRQGLHFDEKFQNFATRLPSSSQFSKLSSIRQFAGRKSKRKQIKI